MPLIHIHPGEHTSNSTHESSIFTSLQVRNCPPSSQSWLTHSLNISPAIHITENKTCKLCISWGRYTWNTLMLYIDICRSVSLIFTQSSCFIQTRFLLLIYRMTNISSCNVHIYNISKLQLLNTIHKTLCIWRLLNTNSRVLKSILLSFDSIVFEVIDQCCNWVYCEISLDKQMSCSSTFFEKWKLITASMHMFTDLVSILSPP